jgi:hypothetical protein
MNRPRRAGCGSAIARRRTPARPRELRCGGSRVRSPPASVSRWRSAGMGRLVALLLAGQQCAARRETRRWRAGRGPQPNHGVTNTARTDPGRREPLLWSQVVTDPQRQRPPPPPPPATRDTSNHTHPQRMSAPTRWGGVRWSHPFSRWGGGGGWVAHDRIDCTGPGHKAHPSVLYPGQSCRLLSGTQPHGPFLVTRPARRDHRRDRKRLGRNRHRMPASYSTSVLLS